MPFEINRNILKKYTGDEEHVVVPEGTEVIADYAFYGAFMMKSVVLPSSLREIGNNAFYNCSGLLSVQIPDTVYYIGEGLFARCSSLTEAVLSDALTSLPRITFFQCENLRNVHLPAKLKKISRACFEQCHSLESIDLPDTVTVLENNVFDECTSLRRAKLSAGLSSIGDNAFFQCSSLYRLDLPESLKEIGKGAFETRGPLQLCAPDSLHLKSAMFDNNWNMNWNFGSNGRYNGKNEENYQLHDSVIRNVSLSEWKPEARCVLCVNYLETADADHPAFIDWISENTEQCLEFMILHKRYKALNYALQEKIIPLSQAEPYIAQIPDPAERAILLSLKEEESDGFDDLLGFL